MLLQQARVVPRGVGMPEVRRKPVAVVSGVRRDLSGCSRVTVEKAIKPEQWRVGSTGVNQPHSGFRFSQLKPWVALKGFQHGSDTQRL